MELFDRGARSVLDHNYATFADLNIASQPKISSKKLVFGTNLNKNSSENLH